METRFKLRTKFLTQTGKKKTYTFKDVSPNLAEEDYDLAMLTLADLSMIAEDPEEQLVLPLQVAFIQQNITEMVDHEADGTLLNNRRMRKLAELIHEYCQIHRLSEDHLSDNQLEAICHHLWPIVLHEFPEPRKSRRLPDIGGGFGITDPKKKIKKYRFDEIQFPTHKQLMQQSIWKSIAMLKDFYKRDGDKLRFIEGIRALQVREFVTQEAFLVGDVFRYELEEIYEEKTWCGHLQKFFQPMLKLMGNLMQVQLLKRVSNENRKAGLEKVMEETSETETSNESLMDKIYKLQELARNGGLNAFGVTA